MEKLNPDETTGLINDHSNCGHHLNNTLNAFQMPKESYYYWKNHQEIKRNKFDKVIKKDILVAWFYDNCIYGYPRIHQVLKRKGYQISSRKIRKIMKRLDINSVMNKKFRKPTTTNYY